MKDLCQSSNRNTQKYFHIRETKCALKNMKKQKTNHFTNDIDESDSVWKKLALDSKIFWSVGLWPSRWNRTFVRYKYLWLNNDSVLERIILLLPLFYLTKLIVNCYYKILVVCRELFLNINFMSALLSNDILLNSINITYG